MPVPSVVLANDSLVRPAHLIGLMIDLPLGRPALAVVAGARVVLRLCRLAMLDRSHVGRMSCTRSVGAGATRRTRARTPLGCRERLASMRSMYRSPASICLCVLHTCNTVACGQGWHW